MSELVGSITFSLEGNSPRLTFIGPDFPASGINPSMVLLYNPEDRRVEFRVGLRTTEGSFTVDLANLPADLQRIINSRSQNQRASVPLALPQCDALRNGGGSFMSYAEYMQRVRSVSAPQRAAGAPLNLLDPALLRSAAHAVIYPPLTANIFELLVNRCRSRQIFGR